MKVSTSAFLLLTLSCAVVFCGCQSGIQYTALENESREQAATIRELQHELQVMEKLLSEQDRDLKASRDSTGGENVSVSSIVPAGFESALPTEELSSNWGSVTSIRIHKLTSGVTESSEGNGGVLHVVLQPLDSDDELVKVAAEISLSVSLVSDDGIAVPVADKSWSITESRKAWTRGFVSSGFHLDVPIKESALSQITEQENKLLIAAKLSLGSSRSYTTSELVHGLTTER